MIMWMVTMTMAMATNVNSPTDAEDLRDRWNEHVAFLERREHFNELALDTDLIDDTQNFAHGRRDESLTFLLSWYSVKFAERNLEQVFLAAEQIANALKVISRRGS